MRLHRWLFALVPLVGCGPEASSVAEWETFRDASTKVFEGEKIYVVEWDISVASLTELRSYYDRRAAGDQEHIERTTSPLMVNTVRGADDYWTGRDALHLRYCISNDFGADKTRARNEMRAAASAWARVANVAFVDDPTEDAACTGSNFNVTFAVRPWSSDGACAFFPSGDGCVARTLVIDYDDFDENPSWDELAPNLTTTGVFRHEIGHILGFRHEHTNPGAGVGCFEDTNWRALTQYDQASVMHYQWCNGVTAADLSLTDLDERGSVSLYGFAVPLMIAVLD